jgi:glycosyltransferase involved in cell wall biosynthesis
MKILQIHRDKKRGFSFDELFKTLNSHFKKKIEVKIYYEDKDLSLYQNLQHIKKYNVDVIHITGGIGYYSLFLNKKKTIITFHDVNHYLYDLTGFKKWIFGLIFYKIPLNRASFVTTVSNHTKLNLIKCFNVDKNKIIVVHNPYPEDFFPRPKQNIGNIVKLLHIGTKTNKNLDNLIEAIKLMDNIELTIIGKLKEHTLKKLKEYNINFINKYNLKREEIFQEYLNCDIVMFVSLHEGFGLPILEANAVGRPVITSNISSMPEVAANAAYFVNPLNIIEIRKAIIELIKDKSLREKLVNNGFENLKRFHPDKISEAYLNVYKKVYDNSRNL